MPKIEVFVDAEGGALLKISWPCLQETMLPGAGDLREAFSLTALIMEKFRRFARKDKVFSKRFKRLKLAINDFIYYIADNNQERMSVCQLQLKKAVRPWLGWPIS